MKSDSQIREEVIHELRWDPQVTDPDAIGVAVKDGAVTLTGAVSTYAQKFAAGRAARRVYGVKAVADELTGKPTGEPRDDSDITPKASPDQVQTKIEEAFKREAEIDARHIGVAISDHTVRLYGHVHSL